MTSPSRCSICHGPFHPATGYLVGHPTEYPICGACFKNDIVPAIKNVYNKRFRLSTDNKNSDNKKFISFYDYAGSSIKPEDE